MTAAGVSRKRQTPRCGGRPTTIASLATYVPPKLLTNADLEKMVEENGGEVKDGVTKGLTYLVMADPESTSGKAKKARELGTECIDLAALEKIIRDAGGVV